MKGSDGIRPDTPATRLFGHVPVVGGGVVSAIGALVLLGWAFHVDSLKSVLPGIVTMKPNTAVGLLASGAAVLLSGRRAGGRGEAAARLALAMFVCLLGFATLVEYAGEIDLGIDQVLFRDDPGAVRTPYPGRMAPVTALAFVLTAVGLIGIEARGTGVRRVTDAFALGAGLLAFLGFVGYLYGVESLSGVLGYTGFALHTAVGIVVLVASVLLLRPEEGILRFLTLDTAGSAWARRLMGAAILVPLVPGWLRLEGERAGLYGTAFGTALYAVTMVVVFGGVVYWSAISMERSDTERRLAETRTREVQARLQGILDNTDTVVFMKDGEGRYFLVNRAFERVVGMSRERIIGAKDEDLVGREAAVNVRADDQVVLENGPTVFERTYSLAGGRRTLRVSKFTLEDGEKGRVICGVSVDVTDRKREETELRQAKEAAEAANLELEAFSYSVSHDLRAPLRGMDGFSHALLEDYGERLDGTGRDYLRRVRGAAQRMGALIDDLLNLSRVSRAELVREPVDLSRLARAIADDLGTTDRERRIDWRIREGVTARADPRLLRVVLENLMENAFKYTARRPLARIEFGTTEEDGKRVYFVRDDGVGFDMQFAGKLFVPFQRLHSLREFAGTGIGLATVKRVVHRHGGEVRAEGKPDAGATFLFTLGTEDRT